jgi:hypothetical protein
MTFLNRERPNSLFQRENDEKPLEWHHEMGDLAD